MCHPTQDDTKLLMVAERSPTALHLLTDESRLAGRDNAWHM